MYNAKRDGDAGGAPNAIPSMGVIEGRITVLEVVAATSLHLLLRSGDKHAAQHVILTIRRAMRAKCNDIHLNATDAEAAIDYAEELLDATYESVEFSATYSLADDLLIA
jgi:hypothetical protein